MAAKWLKSIPIYDQNGRKTIPFGAAHTYIAHISEYATGLLGKYFTLIVPLFTQVYKCVLVNLRGT